MPYLELSQIRGKAKFADPMRENSSRNALSTKNQVFLSHSHHDADLILPAINFLLSIGIEVYVDWLDSSMPTTTSGETANKLKTKIDQCDRFLVLLSENSINSKWVPWELGYADGVKEIENIAILPIRRYRNTLDSDFHGLEYMTLYPIIQEGYNIDGQGYYSIFPPKRIRDTDNGRHLPSWLGSDKISF